MTEEQIRSGFVQWAKTYLGAREGSDGHRKILALYNGQVPLPRSYRVKATDPWCACFVSAVGAQLGMGDIILPECSCSRMVALYQKAGFWREKDGTLPQVGDLVLYDFENDGRVDHIGIVANVEGNTLKIIEGNLKNAVGIRKLSPDSGQIRGYCLPNFALWAGQVDTVQKVQRWLNLTLDARLAVDGKCGKNTKKALHLALQKAYGTNEANLLSVIRKHNLRKGNWGMEVSVLQAYLVCNGYAIAVDGSFGRATQKALRTYQCKNALFPDGVAGSKTFQKLLT